MGERDSLSESIRERKGVTLFGTKKTFSGLISTGRLNLNVYSEDTLVLVGRRCLTGGVEYPVWTRAPPVPGRAAPTRRGFWVKATGKRLHFSLALDPAMNPVTPIIGAIVSGQQESCRLDVSPIGPRWERLAA